MSPSGSVLPETAATTETGNSRPTTDATHGSGPAVQPHADVEALDPPCRLHLARVAGGDTDDPERCPSGALGVVLVGRRDAEVRADPRRP